MCRRRDDGEIVDSPEVAIDIVKFCLSDWECKGLDGGEVAGAYTLDQQQKHLNGPRIYRHEEHFSTC